MGFFEGGLGTIADSAETTKYKRPLCKIGSIVRVTYGEQLHKLATVVNIVDAGRLLVEGPENLTGVPRQILPLKRVSLTGLEVNITRDARQKQLNKAWADSGIQKAWDASAYAKTLKRRETRAGLTDFDRFKLMIAKKAKRVQMTAAFKKLKKAK